MTVRRWAEATTREIAAAMDDPAALAVQPTAWLIDDLSASGVVGDPSAATAEAGAAITAHWTAQLALAFDEMAQFAFPAIPGTRP
jgi:creatinine amidohydrolase/Fe(II)-dependent formamide hydrolase-like protein